MLNTDKNLIEEVARLKKIMGINEEKADRCLRIARRKYDKPSAYRSGAIVRCRQGKIWKDLKESGELDDITLNEDEKLINMAHTAITRRKGKEYAPDVHELQAWIDEYLNKQKQPTPEDEVDEAKKTDYSKEKKSGLHGWFSRRGGDGNKGWVDCNTCKTVDGKKKCKSCGRQKGEKRSKYPSCRPTPASCGTPGKGKKWGKTKNESIHEVISASEAYTDKSAIQTVIDNKRDLGFITLKSTTVTRKYFLDMVKKHNLKLLPVKLNPNEAYIYYKPDAEEKAIELANIANKYGGYFAYNATKEDSIRIGQLLGYKDEDINAYVTKNYHPDGSLINENNTTTMLKIALLFIVIDNKALLFKRSDTETTNPGKYGMLGGKVEKNESPEEALKREVTEEAGVNLTTFHPLGKFYDKNCELNIFYTNEFDVDNITLNTNEHSSFKFFSMEELMNVNPNDIIDTNKKIAKIYNKKTDELNQLQESLNRIKKLINN